MRRSTSWGSNENFQDLQIALIIVPTITKTERDIARPLGKLLGRKSNRAAANAQAMRM
jgi:hypothetical protein